MDSLSDIELAALLCSRVCHDVISPVGAIVNGLELLAEEDDEEMRTLALDLVRRSAAQASAKLQFCRIAFGASGSAGSQLDVGEAGDLARPFVGGEKATLDWAVPRTNRPKAQVKLLLNLMIMGFSAVPRGGVVRVAVEGDRFVVRASGPGAKLPDASRRILAGALPGSEIDARSVQVYYTLRVASEAGFALQLPGEGEDVVIAAARRAA